jgi:hypothetical protein
MVDDNSSIPGRDSNNYILRHVYTGSNQRLLLYIFVYRRLMTEVPIGYIVTLIAHVYLL